MTGSIRRAWRATAVLAGTAAVTTLLLSGCGAGHYAETSLRIPTSVGVNADSADGSFKIRNLSIDYLDTTGYPAGGNAPLSVALYNDSDRAVTVRVSSSAARIVVLTNAAAASPSPTTAGPTPTPTGVESPSLGGSPSATPPEAAGSPSSGGSPSAAPSPTAAPEVPAEIQIPARGFVVLSRATGTWLQLNGLAAALPPGESVPMTFDFGGTRVDTPAPVAVPLSPAPVATPVVEEEGGAAHE
ncbi:hypothetical protein [Micromonospora sp. HM5-17]|uniref:hypothetical protein n=1 Tax=Micromonospora sp. HM5-17 TaxID=2487710 RepID=UPI0011CDA835|nr:hypothetical protein [Micromonospora sp. HM5-17]